MEFSTFRFYCARFYEDVIAFNKLAAIETFRRLHPKAKIQTIRVIRTY